MPRCSVDRQVPSLEALDWRHMTRRALLRTLGLGAAAVAAGKPSLAQLAAAQATPGAGGSDSEQRAPGGPDLDQTLWDLEYDPDKIFRYVADQVAYEAYSGALRGAKGTHWGLAGNSVDQALLLADMLTRAQVPIRFAAGALDDQTASALLASMRLDEAAVRTHAEKVGDGRAALDRYPDLTPEQRAALQDPEQLRTQLLARATSQLDEGLATLQAALSSEAITLAAPAPELPDRERRQHVWVQYAAGADWVDLDPSIPRAEAGKAYAKRTETWDAIPAELYHRVRFRAIVETNAAGTASRADAFVYEARSADLVGVPVVFAHIEPNALTQLGVSIGGLIEGSLQYVPSLLAGKGGALGDPVAISAGGGALDAFDASGTDGEAIGEWLEIEVLPPDEPARRVTREVFDRIGVARRAEGAVDLTSLPPAALADVPQRGKVFLPLEAVWLVGVVGGQIPGSYFDQDYTIQDTEADAALLVHAYFAARDRLQVEVASVHGSRWYHDEPNLTAAILEPAEADAGQFNLRVSLDLLHQGYGVLPIAGATPTAHPRVLAGVLAHVAERTGAEAGAELTPEAPVPVGSVGQVFEEAARAGIAIRTLTPQTADLSSLAVSDAAKARIGEALAAGYLVVVPERAVALGGIKQVGWWQVDPKTGRTFDLMENGRGADLGEETVILVNGPAWRAIWFKRAFFVIGVVVGFSVTMAILTYPN